MGIKELQNWIHDNNPELEKKIKDLLFYDAICEICQFYGVKKPLGFENRNDDADRILKEILEAIRGKKCIDE